MQDNAPVHILIIAKTGRQCNNKEHIIVDGKCLDKNLINCEIIENEYFISVKHEMTKEHYISFIAYVTNDRCEIVKLYPEQNAEVRFFKRGKGIVYVYCNKDGLIKKHI